MPQPERKTRKRGRPVKVRDGLTSVLFLRAPAELLELLDARAEEQERGCPGRSVSRSDVAREILFGALLQKPEGK